MAWIPPKSGVMRCERCAKETAVAGEGWIHVEFYEEGKPEAQHTLDFCPLCKTLVRKLLRQAAPKLPLA